MFEMYSDNDGVEATPDRLPQELEPTPYLLTDLYKNASIVLPLGYKMAWGEVVSRKQDVDGNLIGRENANPILGPRWYEVKFDDGEVKDLTANVITKRVYAYCGKNGNEMLLLIP